MSDQPRQGRGPLAEWVARLGLKENQVRWLAYAVAMAVIGLWAMEFGRLWETRSPAPPGATPVAAPGAPRSDLEAQEEAMARRVEQVLAAVAGAGRVRVTVTLASGPAAVPAMETRTTTRTTQEQAQDGTRRTTTDQDTQTRPVLQQAGGTSQPWVLRHDGPQVAGVLVVAEGARSPRVREQLARAVQGALGVPAHKVTVVPMGGSEP